MASEESQSPDVENGPPTKEIKEATRKIIRVLTVMAYLSSVSMAAIMLSLYYIFIWRPIPTPTYNSLIQYSPTLPQHEIVDDRETINRTSSMQEEPLALPAQIAEPPQFMEDLAQVHSDGSESNWDQQDIMKTLRKKRSLQSLLRSFKLT